MAVVLLRTRRRNQKLEFHSDRLLVLLLPPPRRRRFSRDFRALLRRQRCRPRFASDFTAFLGDCRPSRRRELLGTGLATLRGNGLHVLLKGDRSRRSLLSRHDSTAYHATARKQEFPQNFSAL